MDVMRVKGRRAVSGSRAAVTLALLAASLSCLITATRAASLQAAPRCTPRPVPTTVDDLNQLLECQPSSRVLLIPYLWRPIHVKVSCPKRSVSRVKLRCCVRAQHSTVSGALYVRGPALCPCALRSTTSTQPRTPRSCSRRLEAVR